MEERVHLAVDENHHRLFPRTNSFSTAENPKHGHPFPENPEPASQPGTYVVQVPKDQIYRVPPPEHALIAELRREPPQQKRLCCSCCLCVFISVIIMALILGLVGGVSSIFLKHNSPKFRVENVLIKNLSHQQRLEYDIELKSENPNRYIHIWYDEGGDASLSYRQQEIAVGKYPSFDQGPKDSTDFNVIFHGSKFALPREIEHSMKNASQKVHVSLSLSMSAPVRLKIGAFKTGSTKIAVACNLTVDTLAKNTQVLSQECHTES